MKPAEPHRAAVMLAELRRNGLKLTPQRIAIVNQFADDASHPTAQELFERLRGDFPTMSFATVYNTLDTLAAHGLTGALRLGAAVRFDPNTTPHHHAVCDDCGAAFDLPADPLDTADARRVSRDVGGFRVRAEERIYRGTCNACASLRRRADA